MLKIVQVVYELGCLLRSIFCSESDVANTGKKKENGEGEREGKERRKKARKRKKEKGRKEISLESEVERKIRAQHRFHFLMPSMPRGILDWIYVLRNLA